jgi:hypothetical protein
MQLKLSKVLMFGSAPVLGSVCALVIETAYSGGSNDFMLNLIKGFLIGIIPNDSSCLNPKTWMSTLKS